MIVVPGIVSLPNAAILSARRRTGLTRGNGTTTSYSYDDLGRRTSLTRGNGVTTGYGYDPISRLTSLTHVLAHSLHDVTTTFSNNPWSQIVVGTRDNGAYTWDDYVNVDHTDTANGLNQLTQSGSTALGYDLRGNLTVSGSQTYGYDSQNRPTSATAQAPVSILYDPLGRIRETSGNHATRWLYDGNALAAELAPASGPILRRYVRSAGGSAGVDEVLVWYGGSSTTDRRWLAADERGSVVAVTDSAGAALAINR